MRKRQFPPLVRRQRYTKGCDKATRLPPLEGLITGGGGYFGHKLGNGLMKQGAVVVLFDVAWPFDDTAYNQMKCVQVCFQGQSSSHWIPPTPSLERFKNDTKFSQVLGKTLESNTSVLFCFFHSFFFKISAQPSLRIQPPRETPLGGRER